MKKIRSYTLLLSALLLCLSPMLLTSCDDDDEAGNGEVQLLSMGPSGLKHGDKIKFIGKNLNKVQTIVLPPGLEIPSSSFASQSSELIELVVPNEAEPGRVTLRSPQGEIESKTILSFEAPPVTITGFPEEAKPGTNITITGENVNWIDEVVFTAGVVVRQANFVSRSASEVVVTVPMNAQTGILTFNIGGTEPWEIPSEEVIVITMPTITSVSPTSIRHQQDLTISGTDLDLVSQVTFPGGAVLLADAFKSKSETEIVITVPSTATSGKLVAGVASGLSVQSQDVTVILPKATSLTPEPATPGETDITITGTDLDLVAKLTFRGATPIEVASENFISQSATQIVITVPEDAQAGSLTYETIHGYKSNLGVSIVLPGGQPPPLAFVMYDETIGAGGGDWSWGNTTSDKANTEQSYSGDVSWKFSTLTDGGASAGGMAAINASTYTYFSFSIFGGPGTEGRQLACILNDNWSNYNSVTLKEGEWKHFKVLLSNYPDVDKTAITRWTFKVEGGTPSTIYIDRVGFE